MACPVVAAQCTINVPDAFHTRNGGIKKLEKYIKNIVRGVGLATLQSMVEEYKFKKETGHNDNCQRHTRPSICLFSQITQPFNQPQPPPLAPAIAQVIPPSGTGTDQYMPDFVRPHYGSCIGSGPPRAPSFGPLRPQAPEFIPRQTNFERLTRPPVFAAGIENSAGGVQPRLAPTAHDGPLESHRVQDCHNQDLLVGSTSASPSVDRYGPIGRGRPGTA